MKLPAVVERALQVQLASDDPNGELFGAAVIRLRGDRVALEAALPAWTSKKTLRVPGAKCSGSPLWDPTWFW
jgi:hypothetical protein